MSMTPASRPWATAYLESLGYVVVRREALTAYMRIDATKADAPEVQLWAAARDALYAALKDGAA